ncbi:hypothetical protein BX600DRAFT_432581 [Xylariales sp. PMI_506]|nr:hypothetical protein BX600DRAFT_432581 [Xylariales sp. PMI_506]
MANPKSDSKRDPTHFEILALTPHALDGQDSSTQAKAVRQAYRRALLKHHPDKNQQAKAQNAPADPSEAGEGSRRQQEQQEHYTVDQITEAYTVLSDSRRRREYVRSLQMQQTTTIRSSNTSSPSSSRQQQNHSQRTSTSASASASHTQHFSFQTGVETVDLDDLDWDSRAQVYYRSCRCGSARGYCFRELDLEEVGGDDGELMVQCTGCSLWLRVLFEEAEEEDDEEDGGGQEQHERQVQDRRSSGGRDTEKYIHKSSGEGKTSGWSWKFNIGISIGGGAGASASASAGRG